MKRDMDLIRRITLETERLPIGGQLDGLPDVDPRAFGRHAEWMVEANLIKAAVHTMDGHPHAVVLRLTWEGCEFAETVRSDTLWVKAKEHVIKPSASWTFGVLKEWLANEIRNGFPTLGRQL